MRGKFELLLIVGLTSAAGMLINFLGDVLPGIIDDLVDQKEGVWEEAGTPPKKSSSDLLFPEDHIWFITGVVYSSVQDAVLVRMAQALFPVRDFVTWVIVQDIESVEEQSVAVSLKEHMEALDRALVRFSVPFVLMDSGAFEEFQEVRIKSPLEEVRRVAARQSGLAWVLENVPKGIVVLGHEDFGYDFRIFQEIRSTRKLSSWPVGLGRTLGLSSPIVVNGSITGYHNGERLSSSSEFFMEIASFAFNIEFVVKNEVVTENLWKMTYDGVYSSESVGIPLEHIKPLASNCSQILVWRSSTYTPSLPKKVKVDFSWEGTNVETILRILYGGRFNSITGLSMKANTNSSYKKSK